MARAEKLPRGISVFRGRYRVRLFVDGTQHSLGMFDTLTDARAALDVARGQKARGTFVPPAVRRAEAKAAAEAARAEAEREQVESLTLREWSEQWLDGLRLAGGAESSIVTHRSVLRAHILPVLGDKALVAIAPEDIDALMADLASRRSVRNPKATTNGVAANAARTLRACLNTAVRRNAGGLTASPFRASVPAPKRVRPDDPAGDVASPAEVAALAEAMPDEWAVAVPLAAWCALRLGEVLGLERRDFEHLDDAEKAVLHVRRQLNSKTSPPTLTEPKSDSARKIAVPAFLLPELRQHLAQHVGPAPDALALTYPRRRTARVSQTAFDKAWRAARVAAGRPLLRFHDLRHSGLTLYAQQGATLAELLYRGGHSDVSVALRYQHSSEKRDRALTGMLDVAVRTPKEKDTPGDAVGGGS